MKKIKSEKLENKEKKPVEVPSSRTVKAVVKHLRVSPRKIRLVIDCVRYQSPTRAFQTLMTLPQKGARMVEKAVKTAAANAKVLGLDENRLYISDIRVDGGPVMKRFMSRSMGRADRILKRTSHLTVILKEDSRVRTAPGEKELVRSEESKPGKKKSSAKAEAKASGKKKEAAASA